MTELPTQLIAGSIALDLQARYATRSGRTIELSPQEFRLLEFFVRHYNQVVTRKMLLEGVWQLHFDPHTTLIESHVSRLRARLNKGAQSDAIHTILGLGYVLVAAP